MKYWAGFQSNPGDCLAFRIVIKAHNTAMIHLKRTIMKPKIFIAFCSPAGSTRHVATVIENTFIRLAAEVHRLDLAQKGNHDGFISRISKAGPNDCLFVGSPVYRDTAVPPIMNFIDSLPNMDSCHTVPFVTWGGAFSGIALWQMGRALEKRGFYLAGGAKILAVHSMMWSCSEPMGHGHPDSGDDELISTFARNIYNRLSSRKIDRLPLEKLDYNPEKYTTRLKKKLGQPWLIVSKTVDKDKCTQCGVCEDVCPAEAIELTDYPNFTAACFDCFNCIRLCPEDAIIPAEAVEQVHERILKRARKYSEKPLTQLFTA
jgi:ferredoxin